jgi:hypothetical protein
MMLVLAGLALLLGLRILILAVVQDAANRRVGVRGDLYKIEVGLTSDIKRLGDRHDAQAFAVFSYEQGFASPNVLVGAEFSSYPSTLTEDLRPNADPLTVPHYNTRL